MSDNTAQTHGLLPGAAAALLRWYADAGVDVVLQEEARDRFAETASEAARRGVRTQATARAEAGRPDGEGPAASPLSRAPSASAAPPAAQPSAAAQFPAFPVAVPEGEAVEDARARAGSAATLEELEKALAAFEGCALRVTAKSLVFGNGDPNAELMLIGEAPGREEDMAGEPFVGRSGRLLDRMLAAIGIERAAVRVTNAVPWRPPGNRTPTPAETEMCLPFVMRQVELVQPRVLVCVGSSAAKAVLGTQDGIMRLRGRWTSVTLPSGQEIPATAILHPAYLLRQPSHKRLTWRDLLSIRERLSQ
ncbi:uracil-DNA glycosylase [Aureimonas populi]|uniref:Type-4 uracil-DNA glycosylase n=1 Tax=Aureimonas populi TaxID=1701758 RepID=A0ABW5CK97_9HYPH|nr:uracil-DNA glycosylase [Aureimonas populi]